jgi:hypothetical protein
MSSNKQLYIYRLINIEVCDIIYKEHNYTNTMITKLEKVYKENVINQM